MGFSKKITSIFNKFPIILFGFSIAMLIFGYGFAVAKYQIFPYSYLQTAMKVTKVVKNKADDKTPWYYPRTEHTERLSVYKEKEADSGLILFSSIGKDNGISARIIDKKGQLVHEWKLDWFEIWPDPVHLTEREKPKSKPGTNIHGMVLLDNGDLIFNYENLGLVRVDICGNVVWKLPYRTHHSIWRDEYNNLWIPRIKYIEEIDYNYPNFIPRIELQSILKVSLEGEILSEIDLVDLFERNNLQGLLYLSTIDDWEKITVSGDIFHMNDVEVFPASMKEGIFKAGDIMVSLCNMNAVIVFSGTDYKLRYITIGGTVRQHDPDFIDGNTISIFDNNRILTEDHEHYSKILILSAENNQFQVFYKGDKENPFYSFALGSHQWLPNGNLLITETLKGRIFEIDTLGNIVWEYINIVEDGYAGEVEEAQRLPEQFNRLFFTQRVQDCQNSK